MNRPIALVFSSTGLVPGVLMRWVLIERGSVVRPRARTTGASGRPHNSLSRLGFSPRIALRMQVRPRLDLGPPARVVFAAASLALQLSLIATASLRPDRVFGFQMFNAS